MQNKLKAKRIKLESEIITLIFNDNRNTVHFDYHVDIDDAEKGIRLDLYTQNPHHDTIFLLYQAYGLSSVHALEKTISHLQEQHYTQGEKNSYTVTWRNKNEDSSKEQTSYFYEYSEEEVQTKFFYNKKEKDFEIISIQQNPLA